MPVAGEPLAAPSAYGDDRLFVSIAVGRLDSEIESKLKALEAAGHPVVYRTLDDVYDLGEEFFLWEIATAVAGWRLGINPFDQPNVQESKDATKELLEAFKQRRQAARADSPRRRRRAHRLLLTKPRARRSARRACPESSSPSGAREAGRLHRAARLLRGDAKTSRGSCSRYARTCETRRTARPRPGYGPRFLHSTGQLHKGGADNGVFIQITAADARDVADSRRALHLRHAQAGAGARRLPLALDARPPRRPRRPRRGRRRRAAPPLRNHPRGRASGSSSQ